MVLFAVSAGIAFFFGAAVRKGLGTHPISLITSLAIVAMVCVLVFDGKAAELQYWKNLLPEEGSREFQKTKILVGGTVVGLFLGSLFARLTQSN